MPEQVKSSWADEVEDESRQGSLPPPSEVVQNNMKIVTEYKKNDDGKTLKIVRTFKIEKRVVPKVIALRKAWPKFGKAEHHGPGPNPATTIVAEDVFMNFLSAKEEENMRMEEDPLEKLKADPQRVRCRQCNGEHWTSKCPYKSSDVLAGKNMLDKKALGGPVVAEKSVSANKYVPPSLRGEGGKREAAILRRDDSMAIRITNLSENTVEADLEELVKPFGPISKIFLAKEKNTGHCKGFAYIHFRNRNDAAIAIQRLHGYGYDHLILNVDWSKPSTHD